MRVIAVSDSRGAVCNHNGLDIAKLRQHKRQTGSVDAFAEAQAITHKDLLSLECDYLIPAAVGGDINPMVAQRISAKVVVEAANNAVSYEASQLLEGKEIVVLPDILVNSGGVIVSYFEWVQNLQQMPWKAERVSAELLATLKNACTRVFAVETGKQCGFRAAALDIAVSRLRDAICTTMF